MAREFQLKALITGVDKLSPTLKKARTNAMNFRRGLLNSGLGKPISLTDIIQGGVLAAPFVAATRAAMDLESAMADVRKVVDFDTPEQFAQMGRDITRMSTKLPMAANDIAAIVAAGGQAGIARQDLQRFAEDAVKMGVAFDQTAQESGDMMAKWRTSFGMGQAEVVALADKINYLSNNGAATAKQISAIVTRIGPLGEVAGLAAGEIAAMGSTMAGVGVNQERAATGMQNFMLALTAGDAATKKQRIMFKALRMNAAQVAEGMQKDAKGTMIKVLQAISQVDPSKQTGVLQELFGRESIAAIAPLLTNLDLLQKNFNLVADSNQYTGSMMKEFEARSKTTANSVQLLWNRITGLGVAVGNVLLPPLNSFLAYIGPIIDQVAILAQANPWLIKGLLGAAAAFVGLRVAVAGVTWGIKIMSGVMSMSPVGMLIRGIALAAGFLIANWDTVGPWFKDLWEKVKAPALAVWTWLKDVFLNWTPLGLVIKNWEPIVAWFKDLWDRVSKFIDPIMKGVDAAKNAASSVGDAASNAWSGGVGWFKDTLGFGDEEPAAAITQAPVSGESKASLDGQLTVSFIGAPPGTRVDEMRTNQPGLRVKQEVGMRSLAGAG
jgi:TP901 family phage tail tape measure protein|tara:strand:+ start:75650 stop:77473 length:1824 start_codon:yes stop_codon:yes gene_type:complete